jgi:hypothetical protein
LYTTVDATSPSTETNATAIDCGRSSALPTRLSAFYFLVPVFGLVIGHLLLGEVVTQRDAFGAIVIAVGISLAQRAGG